MLFGGPGAASGGGAQSDDFCSLIVRPQQQTPQRPHELLELCQPATADPAYPLGEHERWREELKQRMDGTQTQGGGGGLGEAGTGRLAFSAAATTAVAAAEASLRSGPGPSGGFGANGGGGGARVLP